MPAVASGSQDIQVGHTRDLPKQTGDGKTGTLAEVGEAVFDDSWELSVHCGIAEGHAKDRTALTKNDLCFYSPVVQQDGRRYIDSAR